MRLNSKNTRVTHSDALVFFSGLGKQIQSLGSGSFLSKRQSEADSFRSSVSGGSCGGGGSLSDMMAGLGIRIEGYRGKVDTPSWSETLSPDALKHYSGLVGRSELVYDGVTGKSIGKRILHVDFDTGGLYYLDIKKRRVEIIESGYMIFVSRDGVKPLSVVASPRVKYNHGDFVEYGNVRGIKGSRTIYYDYGKKYYYLNRRKHKMYVYRSKRDGYYIPDRDPDYHSKKS